MVGSKLNLSKTKRNTHVKRNIKNTMGKSKNKYGVTDKEEKFCQLYVELGNGTQAYIDAYDCDPNNRKKACEEASRLTDKQHIADRIEMIREEAAEVFLKKKEEILQDLLDILKMTKYSDKEKAIALKAIEQYSKMLGYYEAEKHEVKQDINIGFGGMENLDIDNETDD